MTVQLERALIKTSIFIPYPKRQWDEAYGSLSGLHYELLHPMNDDGAKKFQPLIYFFNPDWQKKLSKVSILITPRDAMMRKALPRNDLLKKSDFVFFAHSKAWESSIIEYALKIELIEKIRSLSIKNKPVHVFTIQINNSIQVEEGFWLDCEKANFHEGVAINNFRLETEYDSAIHVGQIENMQSYSLEAYQALYGTDIGSFWN